MILIDRDTDKGRHYGRARKRREDKADGPADEEITRRGIQTTTRPLESMEQDEERGGEDKNQCPDGIYVYRTRVERVGRSMTFSVNRYVRVNGWRTQMATWAMQERERLIR